jgi:hypothetical protein
VASAYGWVTIVILSMVKRAHPLYSNMALKYNPFNVLFPKYNFKKKINPSTWISFIVLLHARMSCMVKTFLAIQSQQVPYEYIDALDRILELGHLRDGLDLYKFKTTTSSMLSRP